MDDIAHVTPKTPLEGVDGFQRERQTNAWPSVLVRSATLGAVAWHHHWEETVTDIKGVKTVRWWRKEEKEGILNESAYSESSTITSPAQIYLCTPPPTSPGINNWLPLSQHWSTGVRHFALRTRLMLMRRHDPFFSPSFSFLLLSSSSIRLYLPPPSILGRKQWTPSFFFSSFF